MPFQLPEVVNFSKMESCFGNAAIRDHRIPLLQSQSVSIAGLIKHRSKTKRTEYIDWKLVNHIQKFLHLKKYVI